MSKRTENFRAADRWDVLEDTIPRRACQVLGCNGEQKVMYEWAGAFGVRWLCSHHRPLYREHDRVLSRIRDIPKA